MKERILTGWTIARWLYLGIGVLIIVQSIISRQWFGVAIGIYFAAMGLFAFGCAAGNCIGKDCAAETKKMPSTTVQDVKIEEVKGK